MICHLYTDGACRGNPGPSGIGYLLTDDQQKVIDYNCAAIGEATNNIAEYQAVLWGLSQARQRDCLKLKVFSDSLLLVKQLNGEYQVKNANLREIYQKIKRLIPYFKEVKFCHVSRNENKRADKLANLGLEGKPPQLDA